MTEETMDVFPVQAALFSDGISHDNSTTEADGDHIDSEGQEGSFALDLDALD